MRNKESRAVKTKEAPARDKPTPSYQELMDLGLALTFPASDPPAVSACERCADEPFSSEDKKTD